MQQVSLLKAIYVSKLLFNPQLGQLNPIAAPPSQPWCSIVKVTIGLDIVEGRSKVGINGEGATGSAGLFQLNILAGSCRVFTANLLELTL